MYQAAGMHNIRTSCEAVRTIGYWRSVAGLALLRRQTKSCSVNHYSNFDQPSPQLLLNPPLSRSLILL